MADKLAVYNRSLIDLGEAKLASLSESREPRRLLDEVWADGVGECLQAASWNFASRTIRSDHDPAITPSFGYRYSHDHPEDWLRTVGISADEYLNYPLERYLDESGRWLTDEQIIYVRYVSNGDDYGLDISLWPKNFIGYVAAHLASLIAPRVRESKQAELVKLAGKRFSKAVATDALGQPAEFTPPGRFAQARMGGSFRRDRGSRGQLIG